MPLPSTFAGASARGEGEFKGSYGPAPIGGPYWIASSQNTVANAPADTTYKAISDSVGNVYEFGMFGDNNNNQISGVYLRKRNISGVVQWRLNYYSSSGGFSTSNMTPQGICLDTLGNIFVVVFNSINTSISCWKVSSSGSVIASMGIGGYLTASVACDSLNNVYFCIGSSSSYAGQILKYTNNFSYIASSQYGGTVSHLMMNRHSSKMIIDSSDNIYIDIWINGTGPGVMKLNSSLSLLWNKVGLAATSSSAIVQNMALDNTSSNIWVLTSSPNQGGSTSVSCNIQKLSTSTGLTQLNTELKGATSINWSFYNATGMAVDPTTNNVLVTGVQLSPWPTPAGFINWYTQLNSSGSVIKNGSLYDSTYSSSYVPSALAYTGCNYDASGNVYLYGLFFNPNTYVSSGKTTITSYFQNSFLLKDINNLESSHQFTTTLNSVPLQYQSGSSLPAYSVTGNSYGCTDGGMAISTSGTTFGTTSDYVTSSDPFNYYSITI